MSPTRSWQRDLNDAETLRRRFANPNVELIDVPQLIKEVLDGVVGDQPAAELDTVDGACAAVVRVIEAKARRSLSVTERTHVEIETATEVCRRRAERQKQLTETQIALATPGRVFAR